MRGQGGWAKQVTGTKSYKLPIYERSHEDGKYSIGSTVNNTVITLNGDRR